MTAEACKPERISPLGAGQRLLFLCGLVLLWPALLNGDAFAFYDTTSYMRAADTAVHVLTGYSSPNLAENPHIAAGPDGGDDDRAATTLGAPAPVEGAPAAAASPPAKPMVIYGRSVYFGMLLYLGVLLNSLWVPLAIQALVAGATVLAAVRHFVDPARGRGFVFASIAAFAVMACTSLPYFVCYLMPDLAVALAIVAGALLIAGFERERLAWRLFLLAVVGFAALSHTSAVAILALMGLGALALAWRWRSPSPRIAGIFLLAAAVTGLAGEAAFSTATKMATGAAPVRPPFLTARLVADGPGQRYLAEHCNEARFVLCRYPLSGDVTDETFLWSPVPGLGGFKALPQAEAIAVSREQVGFVLAVVRTYPGEVLHALGADLAKQVTRFDLPEFRSTVSASSELLAPHRAVPVAGTPRNRALLAANGAISAILAILVIVSLAALPFALRQPAPPRQKLIVVTVVAAILANDVICAWLSGPFARYQTRVVWALPLVVLLYGLAIYARRRQGLKAPVAA